MINNFEMQIFINKITGELKRYKDITNEERKDYTIAFGGSGEILASEIESPEQYLNDEVDIKTVLFKFSIDKYLAFKIEKESCGSKKLNKSSVPYLDLPEIGEFDKDDKDLEDEFCQITLDVVGWATPEQLRVDINDNK